MNIYHISGDFCAPYHHELWLFAVVAAESEDEARLMHPSGDDGNWVKLPHEWVKNPETVKVNLLGVAAEGINKCVIDAAFTAG